MYVMAISTIREADHFWDVLKRAHSRLPHGAEWPVAVTSTDGAKAVNILVHDSIDAVRELFDEAGQSATTDYFEADAANAVGLPR